MTPTKTHTERHPSIDDLDRAIVNLSARINAASYELLVLIREFDERGGWLQWGLSNCAEWLAWRCDLGLSAAREKVRVAHALKTLSAIALSFSRGELSYSKVRALTRVARPDNEDMLKAFALNTTAARVEERCRELRCGTPDSVSEANRSHARRSLRIHRDALRGTMTITVEVPLESGELIDKALDKARESSISQGPEFAEESWAAQQADALVTMANSYLTGHSEASSASSENYRSPYRVTVHVDRSALSDGHGCSGLPVESVKRLCCDGETVVIVEDEDGEPLNVGRKSRTVPTAIKRALWSRDKGCVFPGCSHKRFVDAHHIQHWSAGGETSLDNLLLLCTRHHRLVHEGGFSIAKDYLDCWYFKRPDGQAVPHCGYRLEDTLDDDIDANGAALIGCTSAEGFLTRLDKTTDAEGMPALPLTVAERSPPAYLM
jgi:hypothetical protein